MTKKFGKLSAAASIAFVLAPLWTSLPAMAQSAAAPGFPIVPAVPQATARLGVRETVFGANLTDGLGRSLYLFQGDTSPSASLCYGSCSAIWIPFVIQGGPGVSLPLGSISIQQSQIGAFVRTDGFTQITYSGHPLYYYSGDGGSNSTTNGEGLNQFGSFWYLIDPNGHALTMPLMQ